MRRQTTSVLPESAGPLFSCNSISLDLGGREILRDINLQIEAGEVLGVIGPNGAGKTSLFEILSGRMAPKGGTVTFRGADVTAIPLHARARLGIGRTFQTPVVPDELTVGETFKAARQAYRPYLTKFDAEYGADLVGLTVDEDAPTSQLETFNRRKLLLACLLMRRPSLLLLDEPAAGLINSEIDEIDSLLRILSKEMNVAIVIVEHRIELLGTIADRVIVMDAGEVSSYAAAYLKSKRPRSREAIMTSTKLFGYTDRISVRPGETVTFHVSAEGTKTAEAQLVRLVHGDEHPAGPGFIEEKVDCVANGVWQVEQQFTQVGSFLEVIDPDARLAVDGSFSMFAFIHPTWPQSGKRQCIIGRWDADREQGFSLDIDETGHLEFRIGAGKGAVSRLRADIPLQIQMWYLAVVTFDAKLRKAALHQVGVGNRYNGLLGKVALVEYDSSVTKILDNRQANSPETPFLMAGSRGPALSHGGTVSELYWGKIDRCGVYDRPLQTDEIDALGTGEAPNGKGLIAHWDTTAGYTDRGIGDVVVDVGPFCLDARGYNRPVRGQTGWNWNGFSDCFRLAPHEFGGIEFHADAMTDCNWKPTKTLKLPEGLKSGCYAMRLSAGDGTGLAEEHVVFFVRPAKPSARIAFLFPTLTYLAFANERLSFDHPERQAMMGRPAVLSDIDVEMYARGDFGLSAYDVHADGSGVCFSSYHRPIMNMRPRYRMPSLDVPAGLPADLSIIAWLEHRGYDYDVLTDEDLHREGHAALAPYACVISGTRPEYYTEPMLDATEDYIAGGGRYIYAGANGFNATAGIRDDEPWIMECRRRDDGYKPWVSRHGEHYMISDGIRGGPWKVLGRATQKLVGIGLSSQGAGRSEAYRRMPDSYHRTVSWITKGIDDEMIGDFGLVDHGAAGLALDYYDRNLGTPPHAKIIASSGGHTDVYVVNQQLVLYAYLGLYGSHDWRVHGDIVYFTAPQNGAVFACGSSAFGQALPYNKFDNNVSRLLSNVVDAFVKPGRLPGAAWVNEEKQWA